MQKPLKIREFVLKEEKTPRSFCDSFIYEPSNYEEEKLGILFLTGEVSNFHPEARYLLNYFASLIRRDYYSGPKDDPASALEAALKKANFILAEIKRREGVNLNEKIKLSAAAIADTRLFVSQMGKTYSLLLRTNQIFDLSKKIFQLTNYFPNNFLHTLQGQIYLGDKIIFATENFFKVLSLREFKQIFETETLEEVNRDLQVIFCGPQRVNMAAILIESLTGTPPPRPKIIPRKKKSGALILKEIFEQKTQEPQVEKITLFEETPFNGAEGNKPFKREIGIRVPSSAGRITLIAARIAAKLPRFKMPRLNLGGSPLGRMFLKTGNLPSPYSKRKTVRKKIYLCASLLFAGLLIAFIVQNNIYRKETTSEPNRLISEAQKKMEESDNALIIKNKDLALRNLTDAQILIKTVLQSRRLPSASLDEAVKLATEIRQKIIKLQTRKK